MSRLKCKEVHDEKRRPATTIGQFATRFTCAFLLLTTLLNTSCSNQKEIELAVPHILQTVNMCVPTSAAMVLEYFGDTVSPMAVKSMCPSHEDFAGTYYVDLVVGLEKLGYHWQIERFRANHAGFESGLHTIAAAIEAGNPVLASTFSPPIGHTMVVVGYSDSAKTLKLLDPNRQLGSAKGVSFREFEKIWRDNLEPDHRYIILTHPRSFHRN